MVENVPPSAGEVRAFAQQLLAWADRLASMDRPCRILADADRHELVLALAEAARENARLCARTFPDAGFVTPGWRILLEIFIREAGGYRVSLDSLTEWGELPLLTTLGSINALIGKGLVDRRDATDESRTVWLSLSLTTRQKMTELLLQSPGSDVPETLVPAPAAVAGDRS